MKWKKIAPPALFLLLSIGLVLALGLRALSNGPTAEELAIKDDALEHLVPHYTERHLDNAWRAAASGYKYELQQVSYELYQSRARLGRRFTYVLREDNGIWERWNCEKGIWSRQDTAGTGAGPSPASNAVRLCRFTVDVLQVQAHRQQVDQATALEMGHVLEAFMLKEEDLLSNYRLMTLMNTEELYAIISRRTREAELKSRYFYSGDCIWVQMERDDAGRLNVISWEDCDNDARRFYQAVAACDGAMILIAPQEHRTRNMIKEFLRDEGFIVDAESGRFYRISRLNAMLDVQTAEVTGFALVDLDHYGVSEAVLELLVDGSEHKSTLVLHREEGRLVGCVQNWQGLHSVKADGTFSLFRGTEYNGYGRLTFRDGQALLQKETWEAHGTDTEGQPMFAYYVDGFYRPQNYEQFQAALAWHAEKDDAVWYDLTAEDIGNGLTVELQLERSELMVE